MEGVTLLKKNEFSTPLTENLLPDINQKIMKKIENAFTAEMKDLRRTI